MHVDYTKPGASIQSFVINEDDYCRYSSSVALHFDMYKDFGNVLISKCCLKTMPENAIQSVPMDKFSEIEDVYEYLSKIYNDEPETWDPSTNECTCLPEVCHYGQFPSEKLLDVDLSLGPHCNLHCKFCDFHNHQQDFPFEKVKDLYISTLYKLKGHNLRTLYLTGNGEPFLYKETLDFLESLTKDDVHTVSFHSNGALLNEESIDRILKIEPSNYIAISINGWDRESYKEICGVDAFDKVLHNICYIAEKIKGSTKATLCVSFVATKEYEYFKQVEFGKLISEKYPDIEVYVQCDFSKKELLSAFPRAVITEGKIS